MSNNLPDICSPDFDPDDVLKFFDLDGNGQPVILKPEARIHLQDAIQEEPYKPFADFLEAAEAKAALDKIPPALVAEALFNASHAICLKRDGGASLARMLTIIERSGTPDLIDAVSLQLPQGEGGALVDCSGVYGQALEVLDRELNPHGRQRIAAAVSGMLPRAVLRL